MRRFEGRCILMTGAGSGIGRAAALRLGSEGGRVYCVDVNEAGVTETAAAIRDKGGEATAAWCDVSDPEAVGRAVEGALRRYGALHVLANVAGVGGFRRTAEVTLEEWSRVLAVNLTGTFLMCQRTLPALLETRGVIINTASVAGLKSHPYSAAYCASKGGVVMLTKALAVEYARKGVRINCLCPGGVETPLLARFQPPEGVHPAAFARTAPLERYGKPDEVAGTLAFLASDDAAYINGATVAVDGGMTA
ncbi:SDR family NAD(P)-dependent oxidoreductase [Myxococcus stipitatus]|uniref:SDR family NAD(P)-dependent oxidoreductase n=1 Tax=Myxococcus stipitatus TaxID=83455 RepID=UPI0030CDCE35